MEEKFARAIRVVVRRIKERHVEVGLRTALGRARLRALEMGFVAGHPVENIVKETGLSRTTIWRLFGSVTSHPKCRTSEELKKRVLAAIRLQRGGLRVKRVKIPCDPTEEKDRDLLKKLKKRITYWQAYRGGYADRVLKWLRQEGIFISRAGLHSFIHRHRKGKAGLPKLRKRPKHLYRNPLK